MTDMNKLNYLVDYLQKKSEEYHLTENEFGALLKHIGIPTDGLKNVNTSTGYIPDSVKKYVNNSIVVKQEGTMFKNTKYGISEVLSNNIDMGIKKLKRIRQHGGGGDQLAAVTKYEEQEALARFCKKSSLYQKLDKKTNEIIDAFYEGLENKLNSDYGDLSKGLINMNLYLNTKFKSKNQGKNVIPDGLKRVKEFWDYQLDGSKKSRRSQNDKKDEGYSVFKALKEVRENVTKQYFGVSDLMNTELDMSAFKDLIIELAKDCDQEGDIKMLQGVCKAIGYDFGVNAIKALIQASKEADLKTSVLHTKCQENNIADPKEVIKYIVFGNDENSIKVSANLDRLREIIDDIPSEKKSIGNLLNKVTWHAKGTIRKTGSIFSKSFSEKVKQTLDGFNSEKTKQKRNDISFEDKNPKENQGTNRGG